jgi:hypothetical protein
MRRDVSLLAATPSLQQRSNVYVFKGSQKRGAIDVNGKLRYLKSDTDAPNEAAGETGALCITPARANTRAQTPTHAPHTGARVRALHKCARVHACAGVHARGVIPWCAGRSIGNGVWLCDQHRKGCGFGLTVHMRQGVQVTGTCTPKVPIIETIKDANGKTIKVTHTHVWRTNPVHTCTQRQASVIHSTISGPTVVMDKISPDQFDTLKMVASTNIPNTCLYRVMRNLNPGVSWPYPWFTDLLKTVRRQLMAEAPNPFLQLQDLHVDWQVRSEACDAS